MITRRTAITAGAGALAAAGLLQPASAAAQAEPARDAQLLRDALRLEQLAAAGYALAATGQRLPTDVVELAARVGAHEGEHAAVLAVQLEALGGRRPPEPEGLEGAEALARELGVEPLAPALSSGEAFLEWSEGMELRQVGIYVGAVRRALEQGLTQTLASILAAESQQLAAVRVAQGRPPVHKAFESGRA